MKRAHQFCEEVVERLRAGTATARCTPIPFEKRAFPTLRLRRFGASLSELSSADHLPYWHTPYAPIALPFGASALASAAKDVKVCYETAPEIGVSEQRGKQE